MSSIEDFIHFPSEVYQPIPKTGLSVSNFGRIRNSDTHDYYGYVRYFEDLPGIVDGSIPVWDVDSVTASRFPPTFFEYRGRHDRRDESELMRQYRQDEIDQMAEAA